MTEKDHLIIGLTGNIGSGKSTVLNMLRHLGAYGIDADALARKSYQQEDTAARIEDRFGSPDREALAQHVFNDVQALADLEKIIHPQVSRMAHKLIANAALPVIVIEAIKLLESDLAALCDQIWVVDADEEQVVKRLIEGRGMDHSQISERLANQSPPTDKMKKADVVIQNNSTREDTWKQVETAWHALLMTKNHTAISERTQALLSPFAHHIVQPFSPAHLRVRAMMAEGQITQSIPNNTEIPLETLDEWVCDGMVFAADEVADATHFTVWRLNTFAFKMHAAIEIGQDLRTSTAALIPSLAERFACLHRVESLTISIPLPLKENIKQALDDQGFTAVDEKQAGTAQWLKAGYNVFYKQMWDLLADLEDMRSK